MTPEQTQELVTCTSGELLRLSQSLATVEDIERHLGSGELAALAESAHHIATAVGKSRQRIHESTYA